jgi:phage shock protein B
MFDDLTAVLIVLICVWGVVALRWMKVKAQTSGQLGAREVETLAQMAATAQRLEQRVVTLERILDGELPSWRDRHAQPYDLASNER